MFPIIKRHISNLIAASWLKAPRRWGNLNKLHRKIVWLEWLQDDDLMGNKSQINSSPTWISVLDGDFPSQIATFLGAQVAWGIPVSHYFSSSPGWCLSQGQPHCSPTIAHRKICFKNRCRWSLYTSFSLHQTISCWYIWVGPSCWRHNKMPMFATTLAKPVVEFTLCPLTTPPLMTLMSHSVSSLICSGCDKWHRDTPLSN